MTGLSLNSRRSDGVMLEDLSTIQPPRSPNWYAVAPRGSGGAFGRAAVAPAFAVLPEMVVSALVQVAEGESRCRLVAQDEDRHRLRFRQSSRIFRFPDQIAAQVAVVEGGSSLFLYSRSEFGYYDFGVNFTRVRRWITALSGLLPAL